MSTNGEALPEWPAHGPDFNRWNDDLAGFVEHVARAGGEGWWCIDTRFKYLSFTVDTRNAGFVLRDRDGNVVSPAEVVSAIAEWRRCYGVDETGERPAAAGVGDGDD